LPDNKLIAIATSEALHLGLLSSQIHVDWSIATGSWLGVGNDSVYVKTRCFETFPFPSSDTGLTPDLTERIRSLAEQLDAHRKARQAAFDTVTLTGLYNVLEKLRRGEPLSAKDKTLHEQGLVSVLQSLHDELDAAVLAAYGWSDLGPVPWGDDAARAAWTEALLLRLVALNAQRAAEEAQGTVRWLRPEFQDPVRRAAALAASAPAAAVPPAEAGGMAAAGVVPAGAKTDAETETEVDADEAMNEAMDDAAVPAGVAATAAARQPWPAALPEQMRAVADTLAAAPGPLSEALLGERFTGRGPWKKRLPQILQTLEALGRARSTDAGWRVA
jgi:hypothetical protein